MKKTFDSQRAAFFGILILVILSILVLGGVAILGDQDNERIDIMMEFLERSVFLEIGALIGMLTKQSDNKSNIADQQLK